MIRRSVAACLALLACVASGVVAPAAQGAPATPAGSARALSPALTIPPGGVFYGPYAGLAECEADALARGLIGNDKWDYNCVIENGQAWLVVWPKQGQQPKIAFQSYNNGDDVSAELNYSGGDNGMLRARATSIGPWEQYSMEPQSDDTVALRAANGLFVSVELNYTGNDYGMLRARANTVGPWEKFTLAYFTVNGWTYAALRSQANGDYVSAEMNYSGSSYAMLRARATQVGPWELFGYSLP